MSLDPKMFDQGAALTLVFGPVSAEGSWLIPQPDILLFGGLQLPGQGFWGLYILWDLLSCLCVILVDFLPVPFGWKAFPQGHCAWPEGLKSFCPICPADTAGIQAQLKGEGGWEERARRCKTWSPGCCGSAYLWIAAQESLTKFPSVLDQPPAPYHAETQNKCKSCLSVCLTSQVSTWSQDLAIFWLYCLVRSEGCQLSHLSCLLNNIRIHLGM